MKTAPSRWQAWAQLVRPPNLFTVPGDPIAGFALAGFASNEWGSIHKAVPMAAAALCLYIGGLIGNDLADLAEDARDRPERPLPSGRVSRAGAQAGAVLFAVVGLLLAWAGGWRTLTVGVLVQLAILAYNGGLKHHPVSGALTMGACRGGSVLLGAAAGWSQSSASAGESQHTWLVLVAATCVALYVAGVTWIADRETETVHLGPRRWVPLAVLLALWLVLIAWMPLVSTAALAIASLSVAWAGYQAWRLRGAPAPRTVGSAVGALIRGLLLVQAASCTFAGTQNLSAALALLLAWPVSAFAAKRFYAS